MERLPYNRLDRLGKLRIKFDLGADGRLFLGAVLVGILAGAVASGFYLALRAVQSRVDSFYTSAGIHFEPPPHLNPELVDDPQGLKHDEEDEEHQGRRVTLPLSITDGRLGEGMRTDKIFDYFVVPKYWLLIVLIPGFGGLLCGIIICSFAPEATGEGTDITIKSFHLRSGILRFRLVLVKTLASLVTLGSGGSAGWEGPTALVGAGAGSLFCRFLKTNARERRLLLLAGTAGGIGAIFQVPLGGALFAIEILYCTFAMEMGALLPCLLASSAGYATFRALVGPSIPMDPVHAVHFQYGWHLIPQAPLYLLFAVVCVVFGWLFVRALHETRNRVFRRMSVPEFVKPALGGILLGCVAIFFPQVFGGGYAWITSTIAGYLSVKLMAALVVAKILATALTVGSGGSGGLLGPSLFIGAMLGGAFGTLLQLLCELLGLGNLAPSPSTFVVLGMATFYGGIGKVPLAAAVMTCEIVGLHYSCTVLLFLLAAVHFGLHSPRTSLYQEQVFSPLDSPAHFGDYVVDLLRAMTVEQVAVLDRVATKETESTAGNETPDTVVGEDAASGPPDRAGDAVLILQNDAVSDILHKISSAPEMFFPVVDEHKTLIGLISVGDARSAFVSLGDSRKLRAADLAQLPEMAVVPGDSLYEVLRLCNDGGIAEIPVIDSPETRRVIGVIRRHEIIAAYNERLSRAETL